MPRYLITGGAGFIGSHLTDQLIELGHEVTIFDNLSVGNHIHPQAQLIKGDICNQSDLSPAFNKIDGCFHLAAIPSVVCSLDQWQKYHEINFHGSLSVLTLAAQHGQIPVVLASSCAVYGNNQTLPLHEQLYVRPISAYGCDKLASEQIAYYMSQSQNLPTICLRLFNVYGPRQNPQSPYSGVISKFIDALARNKKLVIYGDGSQTRDFVYVGDVVHCLISAMSKASCNGAIVNVCKEETISVINLARKIANLMNKEMMIDFQPKRIFDVQDSCGSSELLKSMGFKIHENMDSGLEKTIISARGNDGN